MTVDQETKKQDETEVAVNSPDACEAESEEEMTQEELKEYFRIKYAYMDKVFSAGQVIYRVRLDRDSNFGFENIRKYTVLKVTDKSYLTGSVRVDRRDYGFEFFDNHEEAKAKWAAVVNEEIAELQEQLRIGPEVW
jgi:hypothetical protein